MHILHICRPSCGPRLGLIGIWWFIFKIHTSWSEPQPKPIISPFEGSLGHEFNLCSELLKVTDWNKNVTDEVWAALWKKVSYCVGGRSFLSTDAEYLGKRPSALTGIHIPSIIVPAREEKLPQLPPLYFVLPIWDTVVSNQVRLYGSYDVQELDILLKLTPEGGTFVDIGANVGAVTVPLAAHVGRAGHVVSFEPMRQIFQYLNGNIAANGLSNVQTWQFALSDGKGASIVKVPAPSLMYGQNAGAFGVYSPVGDPNQQTSAPRDPMEKVQVRTLDSFELESADVVKIDVEGHAPQVLEGALDTLQRLRPVVWFEMGGRQPPEVFLRPELEYACLAIDGATEEQILCAPRDKIMEVRKKVQAPPQD